MKYSVTFLALMGYILGRPGASETLILWHWQFRNKTNQKKRKEKKRKTFLSNQSLKIPFHWFSVFWSIFIKFCKKIRFFSFHSISFCSRKLVPLWKVSNSVKILPSNFLACFLTFEELWTAYCWRSCCFKFNLPMINKIQSTL